MATQKKIIRAVHVVVLLIAVTGLRIGQCFARNGSFKFFQPARVSSGNDATRTKRLKNKLDTLFLPLYV